MLMHLLALCAEWGSRLRTELLAHAYPAFRPGPGVRLGAGCRLRATDGGRVEIGTRTSIEPGCTLIAREGWMTIGSDAFIGQGCVLVSVERLTIGRDALIAEHVTIRDQDHDITGAGPYRAAGMQTSPVTIGDNVWIGAKVTITRGVTIGDNAVIGANAVVTSDIPANAVAVGAPARVIRMIGEAG